MHDPIFVPISGSLIEPGDGAGDISGGSTVESSGDGELSLSFDIAPLEQKNRSPSIVIAIPTQTASQGEGGANIYRFEAKTTWVSHVFTCP